MTRSRVSLDEIPGQLVFLFPSRLLSGTVELPDGTVASDGFRGISDVIFFDADNNFFASNFVFLEIAPGQTLTNYDIGIPFVPSNDFTYQVRAFCIFNCNEFGTNIMFLQADGSVTTSEASVTLEQIPNQLTFQPLVAAAIRTLSGSVLLPPGLMASADTEVDIQIFALDNDGTDPIAFTDTQEFILQGQSSVDYEIEFATPSNFYFVSARRLQNCSEFGDANLVLRPDGSVGIQNGFQPVILDQISAELDFQNIPIQPDSFEINNTIVQAGNIGVGERQLHTVHESGDVDRLRFEVLEGDTNIRVSAIFANVGDQRPIIRLFDQKQALITTADDVLIDNEITNNLPAEISLDSIDPQVYFLEIQVQSLAINYLEYSVELNIDRPLKEQQLCSPIVSQNGAVALICL